MGECIGMERMQCRLRVGVCTYMRLLRLPTLLFGSTRNSTFIICGLSHHASVVLINDYPIRTGHLPVQRWHERAQCKG